MALNEPAPVAIIGAGPIGLTASILLSRFGVPCRVFEKTSAEPTHPKARGVRVRTMEIFRQLGLEPELRVHAMPNKALRFIYCDTLTGRELGSTDELEPGTFDASPTTACRVAQDAVQNALLQKVRSEPGIELLTRLGVTNITQSDDAVAVTTEDGATHDASFVIAADGAGSQTREQVGIGQTGQQVVSWWQSVYWRGDLGSLAADRPCIQFFTGVTTEQPIQIASIDGRHRWVTLIAGRPGADRPPELTKAEAESCIRRGVGASDFDIDILDITTFRISALNATCYRAGRVFLAGDAAHVLPPTGGLGMNSGIQDVHNLAWKLAFVLTGAADERILDTYDLERRPVADNNIAWSLENGKRFGELLHTFANDGPQSPAAMLAQQKDHVVGLGQDLGFAYSEGFLLPDGTEAPPTTPARYEPTARPGHRAPAHWVDGDEQRISTIDLYDRKLSLLIGADVDAIPSEPQASHLQVLRIGEQPLTGEEDLHLVHGISRTGAVLVRPDGHVAWRAETLPTDPAAALQSVFEALGLRNAAHAGALA